MTGPLSLLLLFHRNLSPHIKIRQATSLSPPAAPCVSEVPSHHTVPLSRSLQASSTPPGLEHPSLPSSRAARGRSARRSGPSGRRPRQGGFSFPAARADMLSLQQQHGGAVAGGGDARHHAPQPAVLGGDWLGFVGRGDLEEPVRNAPSPATFLLPPAPLDDRAAQTEPKPKPGQLAGGDSSCKRFFLLPSSCRLCRGRPFCFWGIRTCVLRSTGSPLLATLFGISDLEMNTTWLVSLRRFDGVVLFFFFIKWKDIYLSGSF